MLILQSWLNNPSVAIATPSAAPNDKSSTASTGEQDALRSELTAALSEAAQQLQTAVRQLATGSPELASCQSRLADVLALQRGVATARPATLASLSGQIAAMAATASASAQDAIADNGSAPNQAMQMAIGQASEKARQAVNTVMAGMKDFDPYLHFGSAEAERAYREREAERKQYINEQEAMGTPESQLNASNTAIDQMKDAKAHGADQSPDFTSRMGMLVGSRDDLQNAVTSNQNQGKTTPESARAKSDPSELDGAMAALRAAGVSGGEPPTLGASHGLNNETASAAATRSAITGRA